MCELDQTCYNDIAELWHK